MLTSWVGINTQVCGIYRVKSYKDFVVTMKTLDSHKTSRIKSKRGSKIIQNVTMTLNTTLIKL